MDADGRADIGDDQQRRIVEGNGVALKLRKGRIEVRLGALIFPAEVATTPRLNTSAKPLPPVVFEAPTSKP